MGEERYLSHRVQIIRFAQQYETKLCFDLIRSIHSTRTWYVGWNKMVDVFIRFLKNLKKRTQTHGMAFLRTSPPLLQNFYNALLPTATSQKLTFIYLYFLKRNINACVTDFFLNLCLFRKGTSSKHSKGFSQSRMYHFTSRHRIWSSRSRFSSTSSPDSFKYVCIVYNFSLLTLEKCINHEIKMWQNFDRSNYAHDVLKKFESAAKTTDYR